MTPLTLTDAQIRDAFARRSQAAVPSDLGRVVLTAVEAESQRWSWTARTAHALLQTPTRRAVAVFAVVALLLATLLAVALVGSHDQPLPGPGRGLAFVSGGNLWVADVDGGNPRLAWDLPRAMIASRPTWVDPDTLLVQEISGGVYAVDLRTSAARLLMTSGALLGLSPDHHQVAVGLDRRDGPHLSIVDIASGAEVTNSLVRPSFAPPAAVQVGPQGDLTGGPHAWSPDGQWLLGQGMDTDTSATSGWIYRLDVQTGEIHDLATNLCCGLNRPNPVLAPDGTSVVYIDYHQAVKGELCDFRCGTIWSLDPSTGDRVRLTAEAGSEVGPVFSPDGAWIAFAEYVGPGYDVSIVRSDGTGRHKLTNTGDVYSPGGDLEPYADLAWDADSSGLTFMRGPFGQAEWPLWHVTMGDLELQRLGTITAAEFAR